MKLCKITLVFTVSLILINILVGAGWRTIVTFSNDNDIFTHFPAGFAVDNAGIHIGSVSVAEYRCNSALYFRSIDHGITWSSIRLNSPNPPSQTFCNAQWAYIISNPPYLNYFTYDPGKLFVTNSIDGGTNWIQWIRPFPDTNILIYGYSSINSLVPPPITSVSRNNQLYLFWSDFGLIPDNPEIVLMKTDDGGNTWYSYDPNPTNRQRLTFAEGKSIFPDAVANNYGIHLVWADNRIDTTPVNENFEIYYKYSTDEGRTWYPTVDLPLTVNQVDSSFSPAIATYGNGLHIVFQDKRYGTNQIFYKRSLDNGQTWQDEYVLANGIRPDISANRFGLHVVYEHQGEIYYRRSSNFGDTWREAENISQDISRSHSPRISADFRGRHIVWYNEEHLLKLKYRQYDILPPLAPTNFRIEYIASNGGICLYFNWNQNTERDLAGYDVYRSPNGYVYYKINSQLITTNRYRDNIRYGEGYYYYYVVALDQTANQSRRSNIITFGSPDYKFDIGKPIASDFVVERDSFIQWDEHNSAKTVDVDNTQLVYRFDGLNPGAFYELGVVYYQEDNQERTQILEVDGIELHQVEVPSTPEMFVFTLPPNTYMDGEIFIYIDKLLGPNVVVSEIYVWESEPNSGSQSGGTSGFNQFGFTLKPNIVKNTTTISYNLHMQSDVSLKVYNSSGRLIRTLVNESTDKGMYRLQWNGKDEQERNVPAGVYIVRLSVNDNITTKRLLVVR